MTDTILRGTGNSRTLRTVANAKSQYPTYDAFMAALVNGTFPIDIGALSSAGLTRWGTDLNKANILTDTTATGMGLTSSATPNDAFSKLRALVKAAQDTADDAAARIEQCVVGETGFYLGTGSPDSKTISFSIDWYVLLMVHYYDSANPYRFSLFFQDSDKGVEITLGATYPVGISAVCKTRSITIGNRYNNSRYSYYYMALGL